MSYYQPLRAFQCSYMVVTEKLTIRIKRNYAKDNTTEENYELSLGILHNINRQQLSPYPAVCTSNVSVNTTKKRDIFSCVTDLY